MQPVYTLASGHFGIRPPSLPAEMSEAAASAAVPGSVSRIQGISVRCVSQRDMSVM
jgi:hypothetical protein